MDPSRGSGSAFEAPAGGRRDPLESLPSGSRMPLRRGPGARPDRRAGPGLASSPTAPRPRKPLIRSNKSPALATPAAAARRLDRMEAGAIPPLPAVRPRGATPVRSARSLLCAAAVSGGRWRPDLRRRQPARRPAAEARRRDRAARPRGARISDTVSLMTQMAKLPQSVESNVRSAGRRQARSSLPGVGSGPADPRSRARRTISYAYDLAAQPGWASRPAAAGAAP